MTDNDVLDAANAWPGIEILQFPTSYDEDEDEEDGWLTPKLTLRSIAILCSHCPKL
jgi:hypothetical protein